MFPTFASPHWLWCLLLLLPLLGLRGWSQWRSSKGAQGLISPRLRKELVVGGGQWSRWTIFSLQWLALALVVIALARPQWGFVVTENESESRNVILAIDTSRSMLANDLTPDRLTRATLAAQDIVRALPEDRIGLIAFAGKAFLQAPLTLDHDAVVESIQQFDTELIPRGGSNLTEAARLAIASFEKAGSQDSALILFSDGEALEGVEDLEDLVEDAEAVGLTVITVGVGTETGSIIPEPDENGKIQPGVFVKDEDGTVVRSRLDPGALQNFSATLGGGIYLDLASSSSLSRSIPEALLQIEASRGVSEARRRPIERFQWPLSFGFLFAIAAWMLPGTSRALRALFRPAPTEAEEAAPIAAAVQRSRKPSRTSSPAPASSISKSSVALFLLFALFLFPASTRAEIGKVESRALDAYRAEDFEAAIEAYQKEIASAESAKQRAWLNLGLGAAAYESKDFAQAREAFGRALAEGDERISSRAHYNLGNTLFREGEQTLSENAHPKLPTIAKDDTGKQAVIEKWQAAREHYEAALAVSPGDTNSRHNLQVLTQRLELLEEPPPPEEEPPPDQQEQEQDQEEQNQDQPQDQNQNSPNPSSSPPGSPPPPESGDEQAEQDPDSPQEQSPPQGQEPPPSSPSDPGQAPPPPPEPPTPEGELEGKPPEPQEAEGQPSEMQEGQVNPETGFSPEEARQMLRALADEDVDARPPIRLPMRAEKYKNW